VADYPRYFINHPACTRNFTCDGRIPCLRSPSRPGPCPGGFSSKRPAGRSTEQLKF